MDASAAGALATPTLMRAARGAYASAIRAQLYAAGLDDLPRNGLFILAGIDDAGGPRQDLPSALGVSKQAVSQLIDVLVNRGYVERGADAQDRRRITLELTERGHQAVAAGSRGIEGVESQLRERVTAEQIDAMRSALFALSEIKSAGIASGAAVARPGRQLRHFSPIFPVADLAAALQHYSTLGFHTLAYDDGDEYGFANRDGIGIHFAVDHNRGDRHGAARSGASTYLYVRDADALYAEWSRPGVGGETRPVGAMAYKLREGTHIDPDGNVIRFGSPIGEEA
jgi:DNA-binding MarR family transcriptional regulator